jgi:hypothetical protein
MNGTGVRIVALAALGGLLLGAPGAPAAPPRPDAASVSTAGAAQSGTARGVVKSIADRRLVIEGGAAGAPAASTFALDEATVVQRLGKSLAVKDLKPGDAVTVTWVLRDGRQLAQRVWVRTGATAGGRPAGAGKGMSR